MMQFKLCFVFFCFLPWTVYCQQITHSKTFLNSDSFVLYPPWIEGSLNFSFRTSESDGLLVYYADISMIGVEYFRVKLLNAALRIDLLSRNLGNQKIETIYKVIGEHLNDNGLHTVLIEHLKDIHFNVTLDSLDTVTINYFSIFESSLEPMYTGMFFGGVPKTPQLATKSVLDDPHFIGCLEDIRYSNTSSLRYNAPIMENGVRENCEEDPCVGKSCGSGVCVPRWPAGYCDCRGTGMLGENCSEDPSLHTLSFMADSPYLCYDARPQPYTPMPTPTPITASIRLLPPLPQSGTIMTGFNGRGIHFGISLKNSKVVYELITNGTISTPLIITSQTTLSLGSRYQLDYSVTDNLTTISIGQLVGNSLSLLEIMRKSLTSVIQDAPLVRVCLGGALLEDINYSGTVENVFFNQLSLTEERYFTLFRATSTSRSSVKFGEMAVPPLQFTKSTLNVSRISFDIRTDPNNAGNILVLGDESLYLTLSIFNAELLSLINLDSGTTIFSTLPYQVNDGLWHHIEFAFITNSSTGIMLKIDQSHKMFYPVTIDNVRHVMNSPLQFGPTDLPMPGFTTVFMDCLQNIEFEYESGETFRPNLEVVTRVEERFSATGCFGCTVDQEEVAGCRNGGTCQYRDNSVGGECSCKLDYSGPQCENTTTPTPPVSSVTVSQSPVTVSQPPVTVSQPPISTPTNNSTTINLNVGAWIGIGLATVLGILLMAAFILLTIVACCIGNGKQGFYRTYETNERNQSVLRYSASLKELSSEVVPVDVHSNGGLKLAPLNMVQSNGHEKEFYL